MTTEISNLKDFVSVTTSNFKDTYFPQQLWEVGKKKIKMLISVKF
jgi:hypothetical protein